MLLKTIISDEEFWQESPLEDDVIEEEVMFTNEINEIDDENESPEEEIPEVVPKETEIFQEVEEIIEEVVLSVNHEQELPNYEERVAEREREFLELEERRRKIVDFSKEDVIQPHPTYGSSYWVCVVNPSDKTFGILKGYMKLSYDKMNNSR